MSEICRRQVKADEAVEIRLSVKIRLLSLASC